MLIGLSGASSSGKDTVADYLCSHYDYVKVSLADEMKRFTAAVFAIDNDTLWGSSERRNAIIPGSDTTSWWDEAQSRLSQLSIGFVGRLFIEELQDKADYVIWEWFEGLRTNYPNGISARVILQTIGTEVGRALDSNVWINFTLKLAEELNGMGTVQYSQQGGLVYTTIKGVVVPDCRFANEIEAMKQSGGIVVRIRRPSQETQQNVGIPGHASEMEMRTIPDSAFSFVLESPEGLPALYQQLDMVFGALLQPED